MLETNEPLELTVEERVTADGVAIRVAPPNAGAQQWLDIWITVEELAGWLRGIDEARKLRAWGRQTWANFLANRPQGKTEQPPPSQKRSEHDLRHHNRAGHMARP